ALGFVQDRAMARVRVALGDLPAVSEEGAHGPTELDLSAAESFRSLRQHAIASISSPPRPGDTRSLGVSFLVERERWNTFTEVVKEETKRFPDLRIVQSGPWPPY